MTPGISSRTLFRYECERVARSPVVWAVLGLVLVAGIWGALTTARLHRHQADDIERMARDEAKWYEDIHIRAARYATPMSADGKSPASNDGRRPDPSDHGRTSSNELPYWQDPTDAAGFSRYFLRRFAAKRHLPLSILAVGQSDLQPFAVPLRLETLFGGDRVYDFEPPRALATGSFDLSFVLVFVLPLCLGGAAAAVGAHERDFGILLFVASQPINPRRWWLLRLAALAAVLVPGVALCVALALLVAGAPVRDAWMDTIAAAGLVSAHACLWLAIAGWCLARGHGTVPTAATVAAVWLALTAGLPLAATIATRASAEAPSPVADVNELRRTTDAVRANADAVVARRLRAHIGRAAESVDPRELDYSTRLILITEEMEERLAAQEQRRQDHAARSARLAHIVSWLSPQEAFHTALSDLAGTGVARHQAFLRAVREFQLALRQFMRPYVFAKIQSLAPRSCPLCPGRLNFVHYDEIPRFAMRDHPASSRIVAAIRSATWLLVLALAIIVLGVGQARSWSVTS